MNTILAKTFDFDAAHRLDLLPPDHKCFREHGHTYRVEVSVRGEPDPVTGMLVDYAEIAAAWKQMDAQLDHRHLNKDVVGLGHPTTEHLAKWIYREMPAIGAPRLPLRIRVFESSTTFAEVGDF